MAGVSKISLTPVDSETEVFWFDISGVSYTPSPSPTPTPDGILDGATYYLSSELGVTSNPTTAVSDNNDLTYINYVGHDYYDFLWTQVPEGTEITSFSIFCEYGTLVNFYDSSNELLLSKYVECEGSNTENVAVSLTGISKIALMAADDLYQPSIIHTFDIFGTTPDNLTPTIPTGLSLSNKTLTNFDITWNASSDNTGVTGYEIYNDLEYFASVTDTVYTVSGSIAGTTYNFTIKAKDAAGNLSASSSMFSVLTNDNISPTAPALHFSNITETGVTLTWAASTDNVGISGYDVYKNAVFIGKVVGVTYTVNDLSSATAYNFTVKARDNWGNASEASNTISIATLDINPPSAPTNLVYTGNVGPSVNLSWNASSDNVAIAGYEIYNGSTLIATVTGLNYTVNGIAANTAYTFTVKAKDTAGNKSISSNILNISTFDPPKVNLISPSGTLLFPSVVNTPFNIAWNQTSSDPSSLFSSYEVQILNSSSTATFYDSGIINQSTTSALGSWTMTNKLPINQKLQVRVRINDGKSWSEWSTPRWFIVKPSILSIIYAYDVASRLDTITYNTGNRVKLLYDGNGNQTKTRSDLTAHVTGDIILNGVNKQAVSVTITDGTVSYTSNYGTNITNAFGKVIELDKSNMNDRIHYEFDLPQGTYKITVNANGQILNKTISSNSLNYYDTGIGLYNLVLVDDFTLLSQ